VEFVDLPVRGKYRNTPQYLCHLPDFREFDELSWVRNFEYAPESHLVAGSSIPCLSNLEASALGFAKSHPLESGILNHPSRRETSRCLSSRYERHGTEYFRTLDGYNLKQQTWVMLSNPLVVLILAAIVRAAYDARKRNWGREK
jgi:hypothetical protein